MWNKIFLNFLILLIFISCSKHRSKASLEVVYFECGSSLIEAEIIKMVLEDQLKYQVNLTLVSPAVGWASIATGMADICLSVWLPHTHAVFFENLKNKVEVLNPYLKGAKIGLAVPSYIPCHSIEDLKQFALQFDKKIYGIDPGAGIMMRLESAVEKYGLNEYEILEGNEAIMIASLTQVVKESKWIVVTAWTPHPIFHMKNLKYLEDPYHIFGEEEYITAICKKNLIHEAPKAYHFLRQFSIEISDIEKMEFLMNVENISPKILAQEWIIQHQPDIEKWLQEI